MVKTVESSTPRPPNPEDGIGERIRAIRERAGLSQTQFHQRTKERDPEGKGISRTVLIGYESGKFRPGARELRVLCAAFDLSPEWLLLGSVTTATADLEAARSMLVGGLGEPTLHDVFQLALLFATLKPHERQALASLAHSIASGRRGAKPTEALSNLASQMALDAELRLTELTKGPDAAQALLTFSGKKLIDHFSDLYQRAYEARYNGPSV